MRTKIEIEYQDGIVKTTISGESLAILDALETTLAGLMNKYRKRGFEDEELMEGLKNRMLERLEDISVEEEGEQG